MHRAGLIAALALLAVCAIAAAPPQAETLLEMQQIEGEQVFFRFWVPLASVEGLYPEPLAPGSFARDPGAYLDQPPSGHVECRLLLRWGTYEFESGGATRKIEKVFDAFLLLAATAPASLNPDRAETALLVEYFCSDADIAELMNGAGLTATSLSGSYDSYVRADSQQMIEGKAGAGNYGEWRWRLVTNDLRHFDTAGTALKIFFSTAEDELRALDLGSTDDFYMHAVGDAVLDEPSPTDRWQDVRKPRNMRSLYQFNTHAPIRIVR